MIRLAAKHAFLLLLLTAGCGSDYRRPEPGLVDCSVLDGYEFRNIFNFSGSGDAGWFRYADPTPGGVPDPEKLQIEDPQSEDEGSNVSIATFEPPRCGDDQGLKLEAEGHNFWGAGFGDYQHNDAGSRDPQGAAYAGISLWARSERNSEKSFLLNADDGRTMLNPPDPCNQSPTPHECAECQVEDPPDDCTDPDEGPSKCMSEFGLLPEVTAGSLHQDLDGDGCLGPGDIVSGTECRLPPPEDIGAVDCYNGGVDQPSSAGTRVPEPNECGNAFHTLINTTETWQLFLIPWNEFVQWPCPNRLDGGINPADIAKFEIKFDQGTHYELWIDNIAFYRRR